MLIFKHFISQYENFNLQDSSSTQIGPRTYPLPRLTHAAEKTPLRVYSDV